MTVEGATPRIGLIWAEGVGRVIGRAGALPWHIPEDLKHFKRETVGAPVVMGRKTWDSLPPRFRPLPGRTNIVLTRDPSWVEDGVQTAATLDEALRIAAASERSPDAPADVDFWVIGGGAIFEAVLPQAHVLSVTKIAVDVEDGDTFAPRIDDSWALTSESGPHESATGLIYRFERYERPPAVT